MERVEGVPDLRLQLGLPADSADYTVLTKSLPSYSAALSAKNALARRARCSV
jgi:hypothetical protein